MRVLMLTSPSDSLYRVKTNPEMSLGPSLIAGGLEHYGIEVDYFDFEATLNKMKEKLTEKDLKVLSDFDCLHDYIKNPDKDSLLYEWCNFLLSLVIEKGNTYDYIGLSLARRSNVIAEMISGLYLGIILSDLFIKHYKVPLFIGGNLTLHNLPEEIKRIESEIKNELRHFFIDSLSPVKFPEMLLHQTDTNIHDTSSKLKIKPSHRIINIEDVITTHKKLFSGGVLMEHPKLYNIKDFTLLQLQFMDGCVYKCTYCPCGMSRYSTIPANKIVDMIEESIEETGYSCFRFLNSNINTGKTATLDLCNEIIKRNVKIKFIDSGDLRLGSLEIYQALREAGCIKLWFGAETLSPKFLKIVKKSLTPDDILEGLQNADKAGIWTALNFIVNFPGETEEDYMYTYNFIKDNINLIDCYSVNQYLLLSGSEMAINPEPFGISVRTDGATSIFNKTIPWDEIGGLSWEEIGNRGSEKVGRSIKINIEKTNLWTNDYVLMGASQVMEDKNEVREVFRSIEREKALYLTYLERY